LIFIHEFFLKQITEVTDHQGYFAMIPLIEVNVVYCMTNDRLVKQPINQSTILTNTGLWMSIISVMHYALICTIIVLHNLAINSLRSDRVLFMSH